MSEPKESPGSIEKKVDEAWKDQVEREKAQAQTQAQAAGSAPSSPQRPAAGSGPAAREKRAAEPAGKPEAGFAQFVTGLAMQAMAAMGEITDPRLGPGRVNLDEARAFIDLMAILEEKTRGNLTEEESQMLESFLYELRMKFVEKKSGA